MTPSRCQASGKDNGQNRVCENGAVYHNPSTDDSPPFATGTLRFPFHPRGEPERLDSFVPFCFQEIGYGLSLPSRGTKARQNYRLCLYATQRLPYPLGLRGSKNRKGDRAFNLVSTSKALSPVSPARSFRAGAGSGCGR